MGGHSQLLDVDGTEGMPEAKDRWDKAKIIAAILLLIAIAYLGYRYHDDRQDQARMEFQWDLLVGITDGSHAERELFVEFAQIVARHTEDSLFIRITESWSERLV